MQPSQGTISFIHEILLLCHLLVIGIGIEHLPGRGRQVEVIVRVPLEDGIDVPRAVVRGTRTCAEFAPAPKKLSLLDRIRSDKRYAVPQIDKDGFFVKEAYGMARDYIVAMDTPYRVTLRLSPEAIHVWKK